MIYTAWEEIYSQGNTGREECISFIRVTPAASEDIIVQCSLFTWKIGFSKKRVADHRRSRTSFTYQTCTVKSHNLDYRHLKKNLAIYHCPSINFLRSLG